METKVEALEGTQRKLTVTVDAKEVNDRFKKAYKDFAYQYRFPGFRRGKAPRPVIDSMFGRKTVVAQVTDTLTKDDVPLAINDEDIVPIGQPKVDEDQAMVEEGKPYTFAFTVDVRPDLKLTSYDDVEIKMPSKEVADSDVDEQIDQIRNYYYDFKDAAASKKLAKEGYAEITVDAKDADGKKVDTLSSGKRLYQLGTGLFPKGFDDQLVGMKKGQKKFFTLDVKKGADAGMLASGLDDGTYSFDVTVDQVKEKHLPDVDDKWAKETAGFKDLADMRDNIKKSISSQKEQDLPRVRENEILYALQDRLDGDAPDAMCENEEQSLLQNFFQQLQQNQMTFDSYLQQAGMSSKDFQQDVKKQARDVSRQDLALDAWARHAKIEVSDKDIDDEFAKSGVHNPKQLRENWLADGRIPELRAGMKRSRALQDIIDNHLKVTELKPGEKLPDHDADDKAADKKPAKKTAAKKPAAKKAASKAAAKKPAAKTAAKKTAAKKPAASKAKPAAKKAPAKKAAAKGGEKAQK